MGMSLYKQIKQEHFCRSLMINFSQMIVVCLIPNLIHSYILSFYCMLHCLATSSSWSTDGKIYFNRVQSSRLSDTPFFVGSIPVLVSQYSRMSILIFPQNLEIDILFLHPRSKAGRLSLSREMGQMSSFSFRGYSFLLSSVLPWDRLTVGFSRVVLRLISSIFSFYLWAYFFALFFSSLLLRRSITSLLSFLSS